MNGVPCLVMISREGDRVRIGKKGHWAGCLGRAARFVGKLATGMETR